jgi:hypothetical protein
MTSLHEFFDGGYSIAKQQEREERRRKQKSESDFPNLVKAMGPMQAMRCHAEQISLHLFVYF